MNKRGLSSVVSTIILILLIIGAMAGIWAIVNNFIQKGVKGITFDGLMLDVVIENASINYSNGIAKVTVRRNAGGFSEEITKLKFIVEDTKNADIFDRNVVDFTEYSRRTFELNLTQSDILVLEDIYKISIAPVYISGVTTGINGGGSETVGSISDSVGDLNAGLNDTDSSPVDDGGPEPISCNTDTDCGIDSWVEDSQYCNEAKDSVLQYKTVYTCNELNYCNAPATQSQVKEVCIDGTFCYAGACIEEAISCTNETVAQDCGEDGYIGQRTCSSDQKSVIQDYRAYTCSNSSCSSSTTTQTVETCPGEQVCSNGECFVPLECITNADCPLGEVCESGNCTTEYSTLNGTINSIWPFTLGEYFDSSDLPNNKTTEFIDVTGYKIVFTTGSEGRCLEVKEYVYPDSDQDNSYIQLNETETGIGSGDKFEIWETNYICTTNWRL